MRLYDDPMLYTAHRWPRPTGCRVRWVIVHDPGNDRAAPTATWRYLRHNEGQSCYHRLIWADNATSASAAVLAPWCEWVGHAGAYSRIPRTAIVNRAVNYWTVSVSVCTYGRTPSAALWDALVDQCVRAIDDNELPDAGVLLSHAEVTTVRGRRTDPRGVDMNALRAAVAARL